MAHAHLPSPGDICLWGQRTVSVLTALCCHSEWPRTPCKEGACPGNTLTDQVMDPVATACGPWSSLHGTRLDRSALRVLVPDHTAAEHWWRSRDRPPRCVPRGGWQPRAVLSPPVPSGGPLLRQLPPRTGSFSVHSPRNWRLSRSHSERLITHHWVLPPVGCAGWDRGTWCSLGLSRRTTIGLVGSRTPSPVGSGEPSGSS